MKMTARSAIGKIITPAALNIQRSFRLFPQEMCLISGAPRSGTSALCEWLGHQRSVAAFPESRILISVHRFIEEAFRFKNLESDGAEITKLARHLVYDYYLNSRVLLGKKLVVDKEPLEPIAFPSREYMQFLVHVKKIFPDIKLLFALRDPIATIWSMSRRTWGESLTISDARKFTIEEYIENWRSCADIALQYSSDPNTRVVQFWNLVHDSVNESNKIFDFLGIRDGVPFQPRQTHEVGFSAEEKEKILRNIQPQLEKLKFQGLTNVM